jgi:hypothetical protein
VKFASNVQLFQQVGQTGQLQVGTRVMVGWLYKDPKQPYALAGGWASNGGLLQITLQTISGAQIQIDSSGNGTFSSPASLTLQAPQTKLGPGVGPLFPVLLLGAMDSMGVPVTQVAGASNTILGG